MSQHKDDAFLKKLLATFKIEAEEHLKTISSGLLEWEKRPSAEGGMEIIDRIFREAHSLKGAARSVNVTDIEAVCQSMESVLAGLKRNEIAPSRKLFDLFHQAVNILERLLSSLEAEKTPDEKSIVETLVLRLEGALKGALSFSLDEEAGRMEGSQPVFQERSLPKETIRISTAKLDSILLQAEELLSEKIAANQRAADLREVREMLTGWKKGWGKIQPVMRAMQRSFEINGRQNGLGKRDAPVMKLLEFLEWEHTFSGMLEGKLATLARLAEMDHRSLSGKADHLLDDVKGVLMFPFASLLEIFPKLVRDLSRDRGKEAAWAVEGEEIEMDRRILEEIKDPLIHLVRNGVDHGIEAPAERERKGKPRQGTIRMTLSQKDAGKVEILIADDGAGIDPAKVRSAAAKLGIMTSGQAEKLGEKEVLPLIFFSGVSTSPIITDLSGRGLGLAIVREKVEKLGGAISVETPPGGGTAFRMVLPLTLATFRGILIRVGEQRFVLPTLYVERVLRINLEQIKTVENRETIEMDGRPVSLVRLADVLQIPRAVKAGDSEKNVPVAVLNSAERRIAFQVDEILHELEVLVKNLGRQLTRVRNISGATVLGTGRVAPILNVPDLLKSAVKAEAAPLQTASVVEGASSQGKAILVAEDSITSRTLLKNILESSGYQVKTAVDGAEAFTLLKTEAFDLVVSDVEMPRMNGFDLTAKIRADKKLSGLPVVLVTALESREDRERGIDVGADAYIVKSRFDQSNLIQVIERLI